MALFLCGMMVISASSCALLDRFNPINSSNSVSENAGNESSDKESSENESSDKESSNQQDFANKKMTKEEWDAMFEALCTTTNVTLDMSYCKMDNNLNPTWSFKNLNKIDGYKAYVHQYENLEYTHEGVMPGVTQAQYFVRIGDVDYIYTQQVPGAEWTKTEYPGEMSYLLNTTGLDMWIDAYDGMTYNAETGVYRLENKVVKTDDTLPRTMYYMELEVRDGKIYRMEHEADDVKYDIVDMDVVWRLDGRYRTISLHYDYGTTEVALPEVEE